MVVPYDTIPGRTSKLDILGFTCTCRRKKKFNRRGILVANAKALVEEVELETKMLRVPMQSKIRINFHRYSIQLSRWLS
jgi:hypothetical protein